MLATMSSDWKKETARDIRALGSRVFYAIVIARALIGPFTPYLNQLIIAAVALFLIALVLKQFDGYLARGLILGALTSLFYADIPFAIFTLILTGGMIVGSAYLGSKKSAMLQGILAGAVSTGCGYFLAALL